MLIRKPAEEVFEAFVDPAVTAKFWFTKSSGRLEGPANDLSIVTQTVSLSRQD